MGALLRLAIALCSIVLAGCGASASVPPPDRGGDWEAIDGLEITTNRLFDLGVADPDRDGHLDVFSVNHKFQGTLLRNRGGLEFEDRFAAWGFSQVPEFPGLDSLSAPEEMASDGVYIWLTDQPGEPGRIHLAAVGKEVRGIVEVQASASVSTSGGAAAEISEIPVCSYLP